VPSPPDRTVAAQGVEPPYAELAVLVSRASSPHGSRRWRLAQHAWPYRPRRRRQIPRSHRDAAGVDNRLDIGDTETDSDGFLWNDPQRLLSGSWLDCGRLWFC
jgi:hypothetical protein